MSKLTKLLKKHGINPTTIAEAVDFQRIVEIETLNDCKKDCSDEEVLDAVYTIDHLTEFLELLDVDLEHPEEQKEKEVRHATG